MSKLNKLVHGVSWGTVSVVTVTLLQLALMAIMARLLDPVHFGLIAVANVSLRFFSYFSQMGIAPALIQKPSLEKNDISAAFTLSMMLSGFFFILAIASSPLIERYFEMPLLGAVTQVLAFNFIISGLTSISTGLMQRSGKFKAIAIIEIISYALGYGFVGIYLAYAGAGVWALVAATMTQASLTALLGYYANRYPFSFNFNQTERKYFLSYGGKYSVIGFIEFLSSNLDAIFVGKLFGASQAGLYNRSVLIANLPVQHPANILTKVLFPIMSSVASQHDKQSISLQLSVLLVGSYAFAVGAGIHIAAPDIVMVLLGVKWTDAIPILEILALSIGPLYISHVAGVSLSSMNALKVKLKIQLSLFIVFVALLIIFALNANTITVAKLIVIVEWLRMLVMGIVLVRLLNISNKEVGLIVSCILIISILTGLCIFLVVNLISKDYTSFIRLFLEILAGVIGLFLGLICARNVIGKLTAIRFLAERVTLLSRLLPAISK